MLTRERLHEHLQLQAQLNRRVHPQWEHQNFAWTRAIMVEGVELLDHYGWKWWKHQEPNIAQAQMELVDIWHFILSDALAHEQGDCAHTANKLMFRLNSPDSLVPMGYNFRDAEGADTRSLIDMLVSAAGAGFVCYASFVRLMNDFELSWERLDTLYRSKNVLNLFRQDHGYKEGTYIKTWYGKEDNEVVTGLLEQRPDATVLQLTEKLEQIYTTVAAEAA